MRRPPPTGPAMPTRERSRKAQELVNERGPALEQAGGMLWMERDGLRLVVHLPPAKGYVRFAVIDHGGSDRHPDRLIGSGTFEDVGTAKDAADRMAERLVTACRHRT